jgi:hypothetical protein
MDLLLSNFLCYISRMNFVPNMISTLLTWENGLTKHSPVISSLNNSLRYEFSVTIPSSLTPLFIISIFFEGGSGRRGGDKYQPLSFIRYCAKFYFLNSLLRIYNLSKTTKQENEVIIRFHGAFRRMVTFLKQINNLSKIRNYHFQIKMRKIFIYS